MSTTTRQRHLNKHEFGKEKEDKQRPSSPASLITTANASNKCQSDLKLLEELKKLQKENQDGRNHTKMSLECLEQALADIKDQMAEHEERIEQVEERVSTAEDTTMQHQRVLRYLVHCDKDLSAKCDDLQNRLRLNNIRIFQIPEGSEGKDTVKIVKELLQKALKIPPEMDIKIERAHCSLGPLPKDSTAPPRSMIVRFLDAAIKDEIIRQAWSQEKVFFKTSGFSSTRTTLQIYRRNK